ncbi:MAG: sensor histidine kinase [Anaerolineae bacterium]|nr:sensor histidine kinase [Anaerolineae bacterium]
MKNKKIEPEFKIEWLYSNLRWFYLLAVAVMESIQAISTQAAVEPAVIALLVAGGIANMLVMLTLVRKAFLEPMAIFTLVLDIVLTLGLLLASGGLDSPLLFITFIPIITTALRYSWVLSSALAVVTVAIYWVGAWNTLGLTAGTPFWNLVSNSFQYVSSGLVLLVAGGAVSYVGAKIKYILIKGREEEQERAKTEIEIEHQKVRMVFELASLLSATLNYERVLETALDVSSTGLREFVTQDAPQVQFILLFGMDRSLYIAASRGLTRQDKQTHFPTHKGALAAALQHAGPLLVDNPGVDPELGQLVAMHHCRQAIIVPLRAGFEGYGAMIMASPASNSYPEDFQDLLEAICNQAVLALQNARLYQNLIEEKERLVAVDEDARKKLARALHDGPTQTIAAIAMHLDYVRHLVEKNPETASKELKRLEDLARKTTKEIRQMLFTLRPLILETQGVAAALQQYVAKLAETDKLSIHFEAQEDVDRYLDKTAQGAIFYIVEEAVANARKHAEATDLWIRLYTRGMSVVTEVEDNGIGFDVATVEADYDNRGSLGMLNLKERAMLVKGNTVIQSTPGRGTKITITIPIKEILDNGH